MPTAIDLFAGAGGFSLGATWAGFDVVSAVEVDAWACQTLQRNHAGEVLQRDLTRFPDAEVRARFPSRPDLLLGGPPCQGFSHAGPARKDPKDPRNSLFREFVRFARLLEPRAVVMENVAGLLRARTSDGVPVPEIVVGELEALGYEVTVLRLEAQLFGVPQLRPRVFFVGTAPGASALSVVPSHGPGAADVLTVRDAIGDLPLVDVGSREELVPYAGPALTDLQRLLRAGNPEAGVRNHTPMRHHPRTVARMRAIAPGQSQSDVPDEHAPRRRLRASSSTGRYDQNNRRMHWDRPCHTLAASFYANFVHPQLHRNFTPREGARIQTFPDSYVFCGKATVVSQKLLAAEGRTAEQHLGQYNQIGNAVPPLLGQAVAAGVLRALEGDRTVRLTA